MLNLQNKMLKTSQKVDAITKKMEEMKNTKVEDTAEWKKLQGNIDSTKEHIQSLIAKAREMRDTEISTQEYEEIQAQIVATRDKLSILNEKMDKYRTLGKDTESTAFKSMQYDAVQLENTLEYLKGEMQDLKDSGNAFSNQTGTDAYKKVISDLQIARNELNGFRTDQRTLSSEFDIDKQNNIEQMSSNLKVVEGEIDLTKLKIKDATSNLKQLSATRFPNLIKSVRESVKNMRNLGRESGSVKKKFSGMIKTMKSMLLSMVVFQTFYKSVEFMKAGLQNLAVYSADYNKSMSELTSCTSQLKNALAVAFEPILNVVIPILAQFVSWISAAANAVSRFFAILSGKSTYTKAIKQNKDYAASLDKVGGSADEAKGSLAGFDDLDVLQKNNTSSGGTTEGADGSGFEEVSTGAVSDWAKSFKDAIDAGDWYGVGALLAEKLNEVVESVSFEGIGEKIADKINSIILFLDGFLRTFDFKNFGAKIGELTNELTIAIQNIDWGALADTLSAGLIGIFDFGAGFFENVDWGTLGKTLYNAIIDFISNIDWDGISSSFFEMLGAAIGGISSFIAGIILGAWEDIQEAWNQLIDWWYDVAYEDGQFTMEGLLLGIWEKIKNIGMWIREHIFQPFIDGFKAAFGINSPSTVMMEMGGYIIEGLRLGLLGIWNKVSSIVLNFKSRILEAFTSIKNNTLSVFTSMKNRVKGIFDSMWSSVRGVINSMLGGIESMANGLVNAINTMIRALNGLNFSVPDWSPVLGGKSFSLNLSEVRTVSIPRLAKGGITTGSTLANIGEAGREAVLPLENNTGWMDDLADKLAARMPSYGMPSQIIMEIDGREFARGELPYFNAESARIGVSFG